MNQTVNANLAHCIQSASSIGGNTYYDICAGTTRWVPWGSADWLNAIGIGVLTSLLIAMLVGAVCLLWHIRKDLF